MRNIPLYDDGTHKFILLNESEPGEEDGIRSNQYLCVHGEQGVLMDPGGFGVMPRVLAELMRYMSPDHLRAIILSHQDPDIVGGIATWLEITEAPVYVSSIWLRFLPHYGVPSMERFTGIPDSGATLALDGEASLQLIPAHFLHSEGQINVYDPIARVLFSGDIGAAMMPDGEDTAFVDDFARHLPRIEGFHRRYMGGNRAARLWADSVAQLDLDFIAPQHGPIYRGSAVRDFIDWFRELECGMDLMSASGVFRKG